MSAGAERTFDDLDPAFVRGERGEPPVIKADDAAETAAMHDVAADVLHG